MPSRRAVLELTPRQRALLGDKLPDTANLALGAFAFGQAFGERFSASLAILGFGIWLFIVWLSVLLVGKEDM